MAFLDHDPNLPMIMVCEPSRESDLESYSSVHVEEIIMMQIRGDCNDTVPDSSLMYYDIDPTRSHSRSSTELNTSSCSRSSSFDARYVTSKEAAAGSGLGLGAGVAGRSGGSKPHKAQDVAWEAIAREKERNGGRLGLGSFKFVQRLGSGDIGSVYLAKLKERRRRKKAVAMAGSEEEEEEDDEDGGEEEDEDEDEEDDAIAGAWYAVKVMDKRALAERKKIVRAQTELEILQALDHPFLPTLYAHLDERHFSCLVMEFCPGGDLHVLRQRQPNKRFCENAVRFYAAEVLLALEYLHMMGIVYRDLKPENVLVREDGHIMLSDFDLSLKCSVDPVLYRLASVRHQNQNQQYLCVPRGSKSSSRCVAPCSVHPIASCLPIPCFMTMAMASSSAKKSSHTRSSNRRRRSSSASSSSSSSSSFSMPELIAEPTSVRSMSFVGTHEYLAPEIIVGDGHGSAVDWWTFGIFIFELLHGRTPFKGTDNEMTLMNVVTQPLKFPSKAVKAMEGHNSEAEAMEGGIETSAAAQDLIRGLLVKDPTKRMAASRGAPEVKQHPFFAGVNWALIRCAVPPEIPSPFIIPPSLSKSKVSASAAGETGNAYLKQEKKRHSQQAVTEDVDMF